MSSERNTSWIQIVTGFAVVVGLVLVIWELQQVRTLARAQLTSDFFALTSNKQVAMMGENPSATLSKACSDPENLTIDEMMILDHYYVSQMDFITRMELLTVRDGLYREGYWRELAPGYLYVIFESAPGRAWFARQRSLGWSKELLSVAQGIVQQMGPVAYV